MIKVATALVSTFVGLALLLSFKSHSAGAPKPALAGGEATGGSIPAPTETPGPTSATPSSRTLGTRGATASAKPPKPVAAVVTGSPIDTRYGTMQVAAVVRGGRLSDIRVLQETDGGHSHQIDASAIPVLKSEALSAQSAHIDAVSGATYTSEGYARSLQSALDKAGL